MASENEPKSVFQLLAPGGQRSEPITATMAVFRKFVSKERDARMVANPDDGAEFDEYIVIHVGDLQAGELRVSQHPLISVSTLLRSEVQP